MTLYLVGNSLDSKLVFASDGRQLLVPKDYGLRDKIHSDERMKFRPIAKNLVICSSGMVNIPEALEETIAKAYERFNKRFPQVGASAMFHKYFDEMGDTFNPVVEQWVAQTGIKVGKLCSISMFSYVDGNPVATLLKIRAEKPHLSIVTIKDFDFPYVTGGVDGYANGILAELFLAGKVPSDSNLTKGLFFYILEETSRIEDGVGGKFYAAEMTQTSYRQMTDSEIMDIDVQAEKAREMYESLDILVNTQEIQRMLIASYANTGTTFVQTLPIKAIKRLRDFPHNKNQTLAYIRALKNLIKCGDERYRPDFNTIATNSMKIGLLTKGEIKTI